MEYLGEIDHRLEELAYRENDGVQVSLVWDRDADSLMVFVIDTRLGEAFELDMEGSAALEVFHHPYAYAAFRGIESHPLDLRTQAASC